MRTKILLVAGMLVVLSLFGIPARAQTATEEWARIGMSFSGEITALAVSPNFESDKTLFVGVRSGGLWRSTEAGEPGSWCQCAGIPCGYTVTGIGLGRDYGYSEGDPCFAVTQEGSCFRSTDDFDSYTYVHSFTISGTTYPLTSIVLGGTDLSGFNGFVYVGSYGHGVFAHYTGGGDGSWTFIGPDGGMFCNDLTITSDTQQVWGAFDCTSTFGNSVLMYTTGVKWMSYCDELIDQNILSIRSSWYEPDYIWVGTEKYGMWFTDDRGTTWDTGCDGVTAPTDDYSVSAIRESPNSASNNKIWEGRSDGLRTSTNMGDTCVFSYPRSRVSRIEFAPGYDMTGSQYCFAFVGTESALYRIPCAGTTRERDPRSVDGKAVALGADGSGYFMGSMGSGLYKSVDSEHMVRYNSFLDSDGNPLKPQITAVCLHPAYDEQDTTCLATNANTLFVAANFPEDPSYNGVYMSVNSGNSWEKLSVGWPSSYIEVRDLAISPNYGVPSVPPVNGNDGTLVAATSLGVAKWAYDNKDGRFEWNDISPGYIEDATWVALTPSYDDTTTCSYVSGSNTYVGFPCRSIWAGGYDPIDGAIRAWYSFDGEGQWLMAGATICGSYPQYCPIDVTGIAFPSNFGTGSSPSTKVFISSASQGVVRNYNIESWDDYWYGINTGLPAGRVVTDIAANPDWIDGASPQEQVVLCAVSGAATASSSGIYRCINASGATPSWSRKLQGPAESVAYETRESGSHVLVMAGLKWDAKYSECASPFGAYLSVDGGSNFTPFQGYCSLPEDVFASAVHERDPNYIFAASPSMGVFVSRDKGENFRPYNVGAGPTSGPCRLTNGYGITMLSDRRGADLDILYVGTTSGIKYRNIYYDSSALEIDLEHADSYETPSKWRHATWASGGSAVTGYWERVESVPGSASTLPVWAAGPYKTTTGSGFANLPAGSSDGWILQTSGLTSTNAKGVRIGYDGASTSKRIYDGQMVSGSVPEGVWDYYYIPVSYNNEDLQVFLDDPDDYGNDSDPDMYIRYDDLPDESNYDYCIYQNGDETVCVTEIENEDFNNSWGPGGDDPPTGWSITTSESPVTWSNDNWYKYNVMTTEYAKVAGSSTRSSQDEKLISPAFDIPSDLAIVTLRFYQRYLAHSLYSSIAVKFASDQHAATIFSRTSTSVSAAYYELNLSAYAGDTNCTITFQYQTSAAITDTYYWYIENFEVYGREQSSSPTGLKLRPGTWYIGIRGYADAPNEYTLTVTIDAGCTQTLRGSSLERKETLAGVTFSVPDPRAPVAGCTWGTVNGTGVVRGTGTTSVNWMATPTQPINSSAQTIIQLPDLTLVAGCDASGTSDKGIFYSPSPDEGETAWYEAHAVANGSTSSKNFVDLLSASKGDILIACDDSDTALGGVWLSGDRGKNWMNISKGFDADSQNLSDLCVDSGGTPSYYASAGREDAEETDEAGLYTRSITASAYPNITSISPSSGPDTGGTTVHLYGSGFASSCPTGADDDCPSLNPIVIFGGNDGTTAYEVEGTYASSTHISCVSPPHEEGLVSVRVRNRDTRESFAGIGYSYEFTCKAPSGMANNSAADADACADTGVQVSWTDPSDWGDGGSGTRTFDVLRNGSAIQTGISSSTHAFTDTTGVNGTSYTYSVRANNGCGQSYSTTGASAADGVAPGAPVLGTITDSSGSCAYGISIPFTGGSGASSHNLYVDGSLALSGVTTPVSYTPANTSSHSYVIRAVSGSCFTNSSASAFSDANGTPGAPVIGTITDSSGSCAYGISIPFTAGSGALRHDLYVDGSSWQTGVTSPASCIPADSNSHSYMIRAVNGTCSTSSSAVGFADANSTPATPGAPSAVDVDGCATSGITITWSPSAGATAYDMLVDGVDPYTSVTSPYLFTIGENEPHTFQIRGKNASCTGSWSGTTVASDIDGSPGKPIISGTYDLDVCLTSGIQIVYFEGAGAARHDLYMDGSSVVTGYASGATFAPGDNNTHSYFVRAISGACYTDADAANGKDNNNTPGQPLITEITDLDECLQTGISVIFTPGGGAVSHNLYKDGFVAVAGYTSGATYVPGDTESHSYTVRAINGTCYTDSEAQDAADAICSAPPEVATGTGYTWTASQSSQVQAWTAEPAADTYIVYRGTKGTLPGLLDFSEDFCTRSEGGSTSLDVSTDDPSSVEGRCFYYLITGVNGAGEGTAGLATEGERQVDITGGC